MMVGKMSKFEKIKELNKLPVFLITNEIGTVKLK